MNGLGLLVLRLALAAVFVAHGAHTLFGVWATPGIGPGGITSMGAFYTSLGLEPGGALALLAGATQLIGGVLLAVGFLTRAASVALAAYIGVGLWKVHVHWGFFLNWTGVADRREGMEYSIIVAGALVCLILAGAGDWSIDGRRSRREAHAAAGRARLRGKV
jgi:putative oxidoreductase